MCLDDEKKKKKKDDNQDNQHGEGTGRGKLNHAGDSIRNLKADMMDEGSHQISIMADMHRGAEPDDQEGRSRFQVTQVLYLLEHHLKYK